MKKLNKVFATLALVSTSAVALASCKNKKGGDDELEFEFVASLQSDRVSLEVGDTGEKIKINTNGVEGNRAYTYESLNSVVNVDANGQITSVNEVGQAKIKVTETNSGAEYTVVFDVNPHSDPANGGKNYSSASSQEDIARRTEILGKLEKYAIDSHLTGITLFENGGYVKYSNRTEMPTQQYITGYGWGTLSEGSLNGTLKGDPDGEYKDFYHSSQTNNPNDINAYNASGSQISDLFSYISSSFWSTRLNSTKNGYEWYPLLAADTVKKDGVSASNDAPVGVDPNALGLCKTWKIYVKTHANMKAQGKSLMFHSTNSMVTGGDEWGVTLEDYEFAYRMLLTGSNKQSRGAEMAGDKTYGIKGAQNFYNKTKNATDAQSSDTWEAMKTSGELGFATGTDEIGGDYIQLTLINEIDDFTAMYTLSSNLVTPMRESFMKAIGSQNGSSATVADGLKYYGKTGSSNIPNNTLSCGVYTLKKWDKSALIFERNNDWFEYSSTRYQIPGIKITNYDNYTQDQLYELFQNGLLDSCGIPIKQISREIGNSDDVGVTKKTEGDSTFKLNVNSCTQERWTELFGPEGKISPNQNVDKDWGGVKPWMSNDAFLDGLYWSIDRETFANNRGVNPSIDYFANSYLSDPKGTPETGAVSYNSTQAHKDAVAAYHTEVPYIDPVSGEHKIKDNYGYNYSKAVECFKTAVMQLRGKGITLGTKENPTEINIQIRWMYTTDTTEYGTEIATYFEKAFNDDAVCGGRVKLKVNQIADQNWEKVYDYMMEGQFDLAFGAISGNSYNPLNFMEVLKSDNSSTFTLNWGPDTSLVDPINPIVYDGLKWSYDGLWECADRGGVVKEGSIVKPVTHYYLNSEFNNLESPKSGTSTSIRAKLDFAEVEGVEFEVDKVQIYNFETGDNIDVTSYEYDAEEGILQLKISQELAISVADEMRRVLNKEDSEKPVEPVDPNYVKSPFTRQQYGIYYSFEIYYSLIVNEQRAQSMITIAKTEKDQGK